VRNWLLPISRVLERLSNAILWLAGIGLVVMGGWWSAPWLWAKVLLVVLMTCLHVWLGGRVREFADDRNRFPARTFRMVNEVPTVLMLVIVVLVVVKPF